MQAYWTYILASKPRGTLYIGVTNGLIRRMEDHRAGTASNFRRKYKIHRLAWFEEFASVREAIQRREDAEGVAAPMEDKPDRTYKSALA
jgi:putative endonuclease